MSNDLNTTTKIFPSINITYLATSGLISVTQNRYQLPFFRPLWVLSEVLLWIFFILLMSIAVGLMHFFYGLTKETRGKLSKKRQVYLYILCIISVMFALLRNISNQMVAFLGWRYTAICDIFVRLSYALYFVCMITIFCFLWYRQTVFYVSPLLIRFLNPIMVIGSWLSVFVVLGGGLTLIILFVHPVYSGWKFAATTSGCRDISALPVNFIPKLLIYFTVFIHLILLIFFLYPLLSKQTKPFGEENFDEPEQSFDYSNEVSSRDIAEIPRKYGRAEQEAQRQLRLEQGERIVTFIYKMCILTLLCVGVDIAITSGQFLIAGEPELIYLTLFDINLLVNIICIVSSFNEWLHMMFPVCFRRKSKRRLRKEEENGEYETPPLPYDIKRSFKKPALNFLKSDNAIQKKKFKLTIGSSIPKYSQQSVTGKIFSEQSKVVSESGGTSIGESYKT